ncbi:MAG: hypothetical protein A3H96_11435 [Acidobacteria bacterium RIFCSPLOWO2_02_FULL_67_36]|nr:MAG: hypothetical protein A3H96_11435 [Acidobacteria bacterium RIFCSPLOWO2_02_FULL_67_36]OGA76294.1 MAG: hypothetical protein A3G27_05780 [Betaproteobacteria bacterium RIFCSPLOWO2_12_FULL_66_14]
MKSNAVVDETPVSAFIHEMRDALARRVAAGSLTEKAQLDREMLEIMCRHMGPDARDPRRRRARPHPGGRASGEVDRKLAAAGPDED